MSYEDEDEDTCMCIPRAIGDSLDRRFDNVYVGTY